MTAPENEQKAPEKKPADKKDQGHKKSRPLPKLIAIIVIALFVIGGGIYLFIHRNEQTTDDAAIDGRTVTISPKVAGYVKTLNIDDNQEVKAGDVLLEIEPADYITRRDKAEAELVAAQAAYLAAKNSAETTNVSAPSNLAAAQAQVASAQANWQRASNDLKRMQSLSNEARSRQELDQAVASERAARSQLEDAEAKLRTAQTAPQTIAQAEASSDQLEAQVKQAEADLTQSQIDLNNTKIVAPMDGRVTRRAVERGNYVQPGQALGSLVGKDLWVIANFKETQLRHMRAGQSVSIKIDAYPDLKLDGKVDSIQSGTGAFFSAFPPENATGNFVKIVQRVPVKITFKQPEDVKVTLGPGMSVEPIVDTASASDNDDGQSEDKD